MRAAGGTSVPLMLDWLMWLSMPNVNAEWEKPEDKTADVHKHNTNVQENKPRLTQIKLNAALHNKYDISHFGKDAESV